MMIEMDERVGSMGMNLLNLHVCASGVSELDALNLLQVVDLFLLDFDPLVVIVN